MEKIEKKFVGQRGIKEPREGERKKESASVVWIGMTWVKVPKLSYRVMHPPTETVCVVPHSWTNSPSGSQHNLSVKLKSCVKWKGKKK